MRRRRRAVDPDAAASRRDRAATLLFIGVGGALGTALRLGIETAFPAAAGTWPWATFCINITGAFLLAVLLETLAVRGPDEGWRRRVRFGVGTGVLGGYTTYSTFMVETAALGGAGAYLTAFGYAAASVLLGFVVAGAGMLWVSALHRRAGVQR